MGDFGGGLVGESMASRAFLAFSAASRSAPRVVEVMGRMECHNGPDIRLYNLGNMSKFLFLDEVVVGCDMGAGQHGVRT